MASGFPGRELGFGFVAGSAIQLPLSARSENGATAATGGGGGLLKRSLTEVERMQQQQLLQIQHALFLRSVKQRTQLASPISTLSSVDLSSSRSFSGADFNPAAALNPAATSSSLTLLSSLSSVASSPAFPPRRPEFSFPPATPVVTVSGQENNNKSSAVMKNQLEELERHLLLDEDDDQASISASSSALTSTTSEWSDAMQQLISSQPAPPHFLTPPPAVAPTNPLSPSTTNSSSSPSSSSSTVSSSASCSPSSPTVSSRQLLLDTAAAIADGNLETASANLAVLKRAANPRGDTEQRRTAMMLAVFLSRLNPPPQLGSLSHPINELRNQEHFVATQMLYDLSPCFKLGLCAANYAILEATKDQPKIHILDFEVGQGGHYAALLQAIMERHRLRPTVGPPAIKITAVAGPTTPYTNTNSAGLKAVGYRIEKLAEQHGMSVRFSVVSRRVAELDEAALGCEPGEALAVNMAFVLSRVADESVSPENPRDELLRRLRALRPCVVALVEQEMNTNTASFTGRFSEACGHYGALLESLDATAARDSLERSRVEAGLARKAVNSVAREGSDRVERCEVFGKWRARMGMAGFQPQPLGAAVSEPVKARLSAVRANPGFTVKEGFGGFGLGFGWMGRVLTVASAWR